MSIDTKERMQTGEPDQLVEITNALCAISLDLKRIADVLEAVAPRDLTTKDKRYLRTGSIGR